MSDCGACIGGSYCDGMAEFYNTTTPKAAKKHHCGECGKVIEIGENYQKVSYKFDGYLQSEKTCSICAEIRDGFTCGIPPAHGELWNEIIEYVFPQLTTGCYDKLKKPEAKAELQRRWLKWKGLK